VLILGNDDVRQLLSQGLAREAVRQATVAYADGTAHIPQRISIGVERFGGEALFMPGSIEQRPVLGVKVVSVYGANTAKGLPNVVGAVMLLDPETGMPAALIDAGYLTELRTAAMTAVAAEHLARPSSSTLTVIGTGGQASAHVDAIADAFPITSVRVVSRRPERGREFCAALAARHPPLTFTAPGSSREAVDGADIVVAATPSTVPVLPAAAVRPGTFVCGIGSHSPDAAEIPVEVVAAASRVAVDTRQGAVDAAGDVAAAIRAGHLARDDVAELGELVSGRRLGRQSDEEITVFKSVGFAALDLVAADMLVKEAERSGAGRRIDF
jgi:ornithine cyclodeaminase